MYKFLGIIMYAFKWCEYVQKEGNPLRPMVLDLNSRPPL
jgi:hypothetical protein